jgi:hypothetical protein
MHAGTVPVHARSFGTKAPQDDAAREGVTESLALESRGAAQDCSPGRKPRVPRRNGKSPERAEESAAPYPFAPDTIFCALTRMKA